MQQAPPSPPGGTGSASRTFTPYAPSAFTQGSVTLTGASDGGRLGGLANLTLNQTGTSTITYNGTWNPGVGGSAARDWILVVVVGGGRANPWVVEANTTLSVTLNSSQVPATAYFAMPSPVGSSSPSSTATVLSRPPTGNTTRLNLTYASSGLNVSAMELVSAIATQSVWWNASGTYSTTGSLNGSQDQSLAVPLDGTTPIVIKTGQVYNWQGALNFSGARLFIFDDLANTTKSGSHVVSVWTRGSPESSLFVNATAAPVNVARGEDVNVSGVAGNTSLSPARNWSFVSGSTLSPNKDAMDCSAAVRVSAGGYRLFCSWSDTVLLTTSYGVDSAYSSDGLSWAWESSPTYRPCDGHPIYHIAVVRLLDSSLRMYYGASDELLSGCAALGAPTHISSATSTDEGASWSLEHETLDDFGVSTPSVLAVVPTAGGSLRMYLDSGSGLVTALSSDGETWAYEAALSTSSPRNVYALASGGYKMYYGTTTVSSRTSSDGLTWSAAATEADDLSGNDEAGPLIDRGNGDLLMVFYSQTTGVRVARPNATNSSTMQVAVSGTLSDSQPFGNATATADAAGAFGVDVTVPQAAPLGRFRLNASMWFGGVRLPGAVLNNRPVWWGPSNLLATEDVPLVVDLANWTSEFDAADALNFTEASAYGTLTGSNLTLLYPNGVLSENASGTATDGFDTVPWSFTATVTPVNDPPMINLSASYNIAEDQFIWVNFFSAISDEENGTTGLTITTNATNATVNGTWIGFLYNLPGNYTIRVTVSDGVSTTNGTTVIRVLPNDDAPTFSVAPSYSSPEDTAIVLNFTSGIADEDTPLGSLVLTTNLSGANVSGFVVTLGPLETANVSFSVSVRDATTNVTRASVLIVTEVNDAPVFAPAAVYNVTEDQATSINFTSSISDEETPLGLNLTTDLPGATVAGYTMTLNRSLPGNFTFNLTLVDGNHTVTKTSVLQVIAVNDQPTFNPISTYDATEDQTTTINFTSAIADEETPLGLNLTTDLPGASISLYNLTFTLNLPGDYTFNVTLRDGNWTLVRTVVLRVAAVNDPPVFSPAPVYNVTEDQTATIDFTSAISDEETPLTLALSADLSGASMSGYNLTVTPTLPGDYAFNLTLVDGNYTLVIASILHVVAVNDAPGFSPNSMYNVTEDQTTALNFTAAITDEETPLGLTLLTDLGGATISGYALTITATLPGDYPFNLTLVDGSYTLVRPVVLRVLPVNDRPSLTPDPVYNVSEDQTSTIDFTLAVDDEETPLTLALSADLAGATLDGYNMTVSPSLSGDFPFTLTLVDGNHTLQVAVVLRVIAVNDPPLWTGTLPTSVNESDQLRIDLLEFVFDEDDEDANLTFSTDSLYATLVRDRLTLRYPQGVLEEWVNITVFDGEANVTTLIHVVVTPVNDAPVWTSDPPLAPIEDIPFVIDLLAFVADPDDAPSNLTISVDSAYATLVGDRLTLLYPNGVLVDSINLTVSDGRLATVLSLQIAVTPVNDPPVWASLPNLNAREDTDLTFTLGAYVNDVDTPAANLSFTEDSPYARIVGGVLELRYPDGVLQDWINLTVSDGASSPSVQIRVAVQAVNDAPALSGVPPAEAQPGAAPLTFQFDVFDEEGGPFTAAVVGPSWITITDGLLLTIAPPAQTNGAFSYTVSVRDPGGSVAALTFTVRVGNHAPDIGLIRLDAKLNELYVSLVNVTDLDVGDALSIRVVASDPDLYYSALNGTIVWWPGYARPNNTEAFEVLVRVSIFASDGLVETSRNFTIRLRDPPNHAPDITRSLGPLNESVHFGQNYTTVGLAFDRDDIAENLTWSVDGSRAVGIASWSYNVTTGTLSVRLLANGTGHLTLRVTDPSGASTTTTLSINVLPETAAPPPARGTPLDWWWLLLLAAALAGLAYVASRRGRPASTEAQLVDPLPAAAADNPNAFLVEDVFLLYKDGRSIFSRTGLEAGAAEDPEVVGAMLAAVQDFVKDAFKSGSPIVRMTYGDSTILFERGEHTTVAVTVFGEPTQAFRELMAEVGSEVERAFAGVIENWTGDREVFMGLEGILEPLWRASSARTREEVLLASRTKEVQVLSGLEFFQGFVRVKVAVVNNTANDLLNVELDLDFNADVLRLVRVEPLAYKTAGSRVRIGTVRTAEKLAIAYYLDPQICTSSAIEGTCRWVDHEGEPQKLAMKGRKAEVVCPLFFSKEQANTALLRRLIETELNQRDVRAYGFDEGTGEGEMRALFEALKSAVLAHDVQLVRAHETRRPYFAEAWFYGTTQVKENPMVIRAVIDAAVGRAEFFVASNAIRPVTGLLAELHHTFMQGGEAKFEKVGLHALFDETLRDLYADIDALSKMLEGEADPGNNDEP